MQPVHPNPENGTLFEVNEAIRCSVDSNEHRRFQGIKMLLLDFPAADVCRALTVKRRTLQVWVLQWNAGGIDRLKRVSRSGRPSKATVDQRRTIGEWLKHPEQLGETHLTLRKLHGVLPRELCLELGYSTLARLVHNEQFRLKMPRSWPVKQDEEARQRFRELLATLLADSGLSIWFYDESGITGDPRPRRRWMKRGERTLVPFTGSHLRENVLGAVHPASGRFFALQMPEVDKDIFQEYLDYFAEYTAGENVVLILDNASWHKVKSLQWHHIRPLFLPPYSPDMNPIERLWLYLKEHYFNHWYAKNREELCDRVMWALQQLIADPVTVHSVTKTE